MKKYLKLIGLLTFCAAMVLSFTGCGLKNLTAPELTEIVQDEAGSRYGKVKWNVAYDQSIYLCFSISVSGNDIEPYIYNGRTTAETGSVSFAIPSTSVSAGTYTITVQAWYEPSDKVIDEYETLASPDSTKSATITIS